MVIKQKSPLRTWLLLFLPLTVFPILQVVLSNPARIECGTLRNAENGVRGFVCHDGKDLIHMPFPERNGRKLEWTAQEGMDYDTHDERELALRLPEALIGVASVAQPGLRWGRRQEYWQFGHISHIIMGESETGDQPKNPQEHEPPWLHKVIAEGELSWHAEQILPTTPSNTSANNGGTAGELAEWELGVGDQATSLERLASILLDFTTRRFRRSARGSAEVNQAKGIVWQVNYKYKGDMGEYTRNAVEKVLQTDEITSHLGAVRAYSDFSFWLFGLEFYATRAYSEMEPKSRQMLAAIIKKHSFTSAAHNEAAAGFFSRLEKYVAAENKQGSSAKIRLFICLKYHGRQIAGYAAYERSVGYDGVIPANYYRIVHIEMAPVLQLVSESTIETATGSEKQAPQKQQLPIDHNYPVAMRALLFNLVIHLYRTRQFADATPTEAEPMGVSFLSDDSLNKTHAKLRAVLIEALGVPKEMLGDGGSPPRELFSLQFNPSKVAECGQITLKRGDEGVGVNGVACHDRETVAFARIDDPAHPTVEMPVDPDGPAKLIKRAGNGVGNAWESAHRYLLIHQPRTMPYEEKGVWLRKLESEWKVREGLNWAADYKARLDRMDYAPGIVNQSDVSVSLMLVDYALHLCCSAGGNALTNAEEWRKQRVEGIAWRGVSGMDEDKSSIVRALEAESFIGNLGAFTKSPNYEVAPLRVDAYANGWRRKLPDRHMAKLLDSRTASQQQKPRGNVKDEEGYAAAMAKDAKFHADLKRYLEDEKRIVVVDKGEEGDAAAGAGEVEQLSFALTIDNASLMEQAAVPNRKDEKETAAAVAAGNVKEGDANEAIGVFLVFTYDGREIAGYAVYSRRSDAISSTLGKDVGKEVKAHFLVKHVVMAPETPSNSKERCSPSTGRPLVRVHNNGVAARRLLTGLVEHLHDLYFIDDEGYDKPKGVYLVDSEQGRDPVLKGAYEEVFGRGKSQGGATHYALEFVTEKKEETLAKYDLGKVSLKSERTKLAECGTLETKEGEMRGIACHDNELVIHVAIASPQQSNALLLVEDKKAKPTTLQHQFYWKLNERRAMAYKEESWMKELTTAFKQPSLLLWKPQHREQFHQDEWGSAVIKVPGHALALAIVNYALHICNVAPMGISPQHPSAGGIAGIVWKDQVKAEADPLFIKSVKDALVANHTAKKMSRFKKDVGGGWGSLDFYTVELYSKLETAARKRIDSFVDKGTAGGNKFHVELARWMGRKVESVEKTGGEPPKEGEAGEKEKGEEKEEFIEEGQEKILLCTDYLAQNVDGYAVYSEVSEFVQSGDVAEKQTKRRVYHVKQLSVAPDVIDDTAGEPGHTSGAAMRMCIPSLVGQFKKKFDAAHFALDADPPSIPKGIYLTVRKEDTPLIDIIKEVLSTDDWEITEEKDGFVQLQMMFKMIRLRP